MHIFYSPLEQFEISSYASYPKIWTSVFCDLYQYNFFFNSDFIIADSNNIFLIFFIFFLVKILGSLVKVRNVFFIFFFTMACLSSVYFLTLVDYKLTEVVFLKDINNFYQNVNYGLMLDEWTVMFVTWLSFFFVSLAVYVVHAEVTDLNQMKLIPNFNVMVGEIIYKATFGLFVQTLGKDITSREFFIKIKSIFLFLLITNLQGMIPYTSTVTSSLSNTFFMALALFISIIVTILDKKGINYFLGLFMPPGCPVGLIFLLIPIEVISYSFRVVSLSVRLFANMMAGHTLLKVIVGFSWIMVFMGDGMVLCNLIPIVILFILTLLEIGVALIQAYIFTILSCIYIRDIFEAH